MKTWSRKKRWLVRGIASVILLPVIFYASAFLIRIVNLFHAHEHCMLQARSALMIYSGDHKGKFPFHTNGFGDAILLLHKECTGNPLFLFTAPGDNGDYLNQCLQSGANVSEDRCTRAYVQGLSDTNNPEIALLFDRYPTRGGDHGRRPWGPLLREVALINGIPTGILEENWPEFKQKQIELLVAEGISRTEAEKLYEPIAR